MALFKKKKKPFVVTLSAERTLAIVYMRKKLTPFPSSLLEPAACAHVLIVSP